MTEKNHFDSLKYNRDDSYGTSMFDLTFGVLLSIRGLNPNRK